MCRTIINHKRQISSGDRIVVTTFTWKRNKVAEYTSIINHSYKMFQNSISFFSLFANIEKSIGFTTNSEQRSTPTYHHHFHRWTFVVFFFFFLWFHFTISGFQFVQQTRGKSLVFMTSTFFPLNIPTRIHSQSKELQTEIIIINLKFIRKYQKKFSMVFGIRNEKELQVAYSLFTIWNYDADDDATPNIH